MRVLHKAACVLLILVVSAHETARAGELYAIANDPDILYALDPTGGELGPVGSYTLTNPGSEFAIGGLEFAPDGTLYGISLTSSARLYSIDPLGAGMVEIGPLGVNAFEGGLAFDPTNGTLFGVNAVVSGAASLFTIDITTGAATIIGTIHNGAHDFNGLAFDGGGTLYGIDRLTNALWKIDKQTPDGPGTQQVGSGLGPLVTVGDFGGMAVDTDLGLVYGYAEGSRTLFTVDLVTGLATMVQQLGPDAPSITGLAFIPEPATVGLFLLGTTLVLRRGRRRP